MTVPVAATIAASDSGGGAGIQADLKTFAACGVYGCSVVTAVTAQDTVGIRAMEAVSAELVAAQLDAVTADLHPAAWKTGMLAKAAIVEVVVEWRAGGGGPLVVDPVMVASSGTPLLDPAAVAALRRLLPLTTVLTPNVAEAEVLLGGTTVDRLTAGDRARALTDLGPAVVVLKGGHLPGEVVVDVVVGRDGRVVELVYPRVATRSTHGTGCTLSAAIAAFLARGVEVFDAIASARDYVQVALERALPLGRGRGPLGHVDPGVAAPVVPAPAPPSSAR